MNRLQRIEHQLTVELEPTQLEVVDVSHQHAGHAGSRPSGETHYRVRIASPSFADKTRVQCHRMVTYALKTEFSQGLHALEIELTSGGERTA